MHGDYADEGECACEGNEAARRSDRRRVGATQRHENDDKGRMGSRKANDPAGHGERVRPSWTANSTGFRQRRRNGRYSGA
jgi:hypothetical protein